MRLKYKVNNGAEQTINAKTGSFQITADGTYTIIVWAEDNQGNRSEVNTLSAFTKDQTAPNAPTVTATTNPDGTNNWYKGNVTIRITAGADSTSGAYQLKYSINGGTSYTTETITTKDVVIQIEGTTRIIAYTIDKAGNQSAIGGETTVKIDKTNPTATLTLGTVGTTTVVATGGGSDANGIVSYRYDYKLNSETNWTNGVAKNSTSHTYTGLKDGTKYDFRVVTTDNAGRAGTSATKSATTVVANTAPVIESAVFSSKTTNSLTFTAKATDAQNDKLTYTLYVSTDGNNWTSKQILSNQTSGTTVTLTAGGLSEYTNYYWKIDVSDGKLNSAGRSSTIRTYCPGGQRRTCSKCNGNGEYPCPGICNDVINGKRLVV